MALPLGEEDDADVLCSEDQGVKLFTAVFDFAEFLSNFSQNIRPP